MQICPSKKQMIARTCSATRRGHREAFPYLFSLENFTFADAAVVVWVSLDASSSHGEACRGNKTVKTWPVERRLH